VFKQSAPVIKLPAARRRTSTSPCSACSNSSTACFWMKQVFHNKGLRGQGGGITATDWEQFFEFDSTKIKLFPIVEHAEEGAALCCGPGQGCTSARRAFRFRALGGQSRLDEYGSAGPAFGRAAKHATEMTFLPHGGPPGRTRLARLRPLRS